jgi:hypothetical protein
MDFHPMILFEPLVFYDLNIQFMRRIQESEVKDALKIMKEDKVMGSDEIPIEVWRNLEDVAIV